MHRVGWRYRFRGSLGPQPQTRFADARLTDERDGTALLNPGHVLAAADADRATFDADRGGAKLEEMSGIAVARLTCRNCGGPLHAREGRYILKYFLLDASVRT
jgi:hypothetical protein